LTDEQRKGLVQLRRNRQGKVGERCAYVLSYATGMKIKDIAENMRQHEQTIRYWLKVYLELGLAGLKGKKPSGRPPVKGRQAYDKVKTIIVQSPTFYGFVEEGWTISMLLEVLARDNLHVSSSCLKRVLKQNHWCYKRFRKRVSVRAPSAEEKRAHLAEMVAHLSAIQKECSCEIFFVDESHFINGCYVQRGWFLIGSAPSAPSPTQRESASIFGAIQARTGNCYWRREDRGTARRFIRFLHQLHANFPGVTLVVICGNASIHRSAKVKKFVQKYPWIRFAYLPPYSPEYNPIERFWLWLKKTVYGATSYHSIFAVVEKIRRVVRQYNQGTIWSTISFSFEPYEILLN